jgi:hypothetical protein
MDLGRGPTKSMAMSVRGFRGKEGVNIFPVEDDVRAFVL